MKAPHDWDPTHLVAEEGSKKSVQVMVRGGFAWTYLSWTTSGDSDYAINDGVWIRSADGRPVRGAIRELEQE